MTLPEVGNCDFTSEHRKDNAGMQAGGREFKHSLPTTLSGRIKFDQSHAKPSTGWWDDSRAAFFLPVQQHTVYAFMGVYFP
jgi:hypothetical protein